MRYLNIIPVLLLLFACAVGVAQADIRTTELDIAVYLQPEIPENPQLSAATLANANRVLQQASFTPVNDTRIAYHQGITWIKITWDPSLQPRWLINDYPSLGYENIYVLKDGRIIREIISGQHRPFNYRAVAYHKLLSDMRGADSVLMRVSYQHVPLMLRLLNKGEFEHERLTEMMWYAAVYAIVIVMFLYNLFIYIYLRESRYLYYCFYLLAMLFTQMRLSGLGKQYLWPNLITYTSHLNIFSTVIVTIAGILFIRSFLNRRYLTPLKQRALIGSAILCGVTFLLYWFKPLWPIMDIVSVIGSQLMLLLSLIIIYTVIISNWRAGDRGARVLVVTYTVINVASFIAVMRYNGFLQNHFFIEHVIDIAIVFEAVVLSLALAAKIQQLRQEKIAAEIRQRITHQGFSRRLLSVQEEEKKSISSALHDNFTHQLLLLKEAIGKKLGQDADETRRTVKILHDVRHFSHVIHPYMLEQLGLAAALYDMIEQVANTHTLDIHASIDELNIDEEQRILLYRIVQECLNNVIKHADASECLIVIRAGDANKNTDHELIIKDDGQGFDPLSTKASLGLATLRERTHMLGGTLTIQSLTVADTSSDKSMPKGTMVHIVFPCKASNDKTATTGDPYD